MKGQKRAYMKEPNFGNAEPMNTSRMARNLGTTDKPKMDDSRKSPDKNKPDLQEIAAQARKEARQRLESRRKEREQKRPGAGREDMMSRQRQQMIMAREEQKKKNEKEKGGSNVVGA